MFETIKLRTEKIDIYDVEIERYNSSVGSFEYTAKITQDGREIATYRIGRRQKVDSKETLMEYLKKVLSREKRFTNILPFTREQLKQVYSGRPGCMCGRRGDYYEHKKQLDKMFKKMKNLESTGVEYYPSHEGKIYTVYKSPERQYTAYLEDSEGKK